MNFRGRWSGPVISWSNGHYFRRQRETVGKLGDIKNISISYNYYTHIYFNISQLLEAVLKCWASNFSYIAVQYRRFGREKLKT